MGQQTLKLNDVLASLGEDGQEASYEKTASAAPAPSQARQELLGILGRGTEKVAAEDGGEVATTRSYRGATPTNDLEKIAEEVQATETEALVKEAQFYGAAICDGFMARMSQFEEAAGVVDASGNAGGGQRSHEQEDTGYDREKVAAEVFNDIEQEAADMANDFIKEAAEQGYEVTAEQALEKVAADVHAQGYNETLEKIAEDFRTQGVEDTMEKLAEDFYEIGFEKTSEEIAEAVRALGFEETLEKIAQDLHEAGEEEAVDMLTKVAFDQGYEDAMEKIAESAFNQGYSDMHSLLQQAG